MSFSRILLASAVMLGAFAVPPAIAAGKRMYKPYTVTTPVPVQPGPVATPAAGAAVCTNAALGPVKVASDPEEGGQLTAASTTATKPVVSEVSVMKSSDKASAKPAESAAPAC